MKTKILFITTLTLFTFSGCSKPETKFYEKSGKTYFVDKDGDIFIIEGTSKVRIEDYVEPVIPIFNDYKTYTYEVKWNELNLLYDTKIKYIDDDVSYQVRIKDIDGEQFDKTDYYEKVSDSSNRGILKFVTSEGFDIYRLDLDGLGTKTLDDNSELIGFTYTGSFSLSKEKFTLIENFQVLTNF